MFRATAIQCGTKGCGGTMTSIWPDANGLFAEAFTFRLACNPLLFPNINLLASNAAPAPSVRLPVPCLKETPLVIFCTWQRVFILAGSVLSRWFVCRSFVDVDRLRHVQVLLHSPSPKRLFWGGTLFAASEPMQISSGKKEVRNRARLSHKGYD